MLDLGTPFCKHSFRASAKNARETRTLEQLAQLARPRSRQERESGRRRERRVSQQGPPHHGPKGPSGVCGDRFEPRGLRLGPGRGLDYVRLRREPVVEKRRHDPRIGVEPKDEDQPPSRRPREVDPLREGHFRQPAQEIALGRPPDLGVDPNVGRQLGEVAPEERRDERERLSPGGAGMPGERPPDDVKPPQSPVLDDLLERFLGEVAPPQELQDLAFGPGPPRRGRRLLLRNRHRRRRGLVSPHPPSTSLSRRLPGLRTHASERDRASRVTLSITPSTEHSASPASSTARIRAEPTTIPSARPAASAAPPGVEIPNPTARGKPPAALLARRTVSGREASSAPRAPVIPARDTT